MDMLATFRCNVKGTLLLGTVLGAALAALPAMSDTLRVVMPSGLRILDPTIQTGFITRDHAYMIYDTLLGVDSTFTPRPQMADWTVSADGLIYTFTLREGLKWHDGAAVTSDDAVASILRWSKVDGTAQPLMTLVKSIDVLDAKSFTVTLTEPTGLLLAGLSKISSRPAFIMPKAVAETPTSEPITNTIGSGPFRFKADEFQPGLKVVYEKNEDYVPRAEPSDWTSGAKVVKVDRVEWITMPDQTTAVNAIQSDEVDFIQQVPFDLMPILEGNPEISLKVLDPMGSWTYFRMNHLHAPFNDKLTRRAAMAAVAQEDVLQALVGNAEYFKVCAAIMGCGSPNGLEAERDFVVSADLDKARELLAQSSYKGEPVMIMQPTDNPMLAAQPVVVGAALRAAGFNVQMKTMDWQSIVANLSNKGPVSENGWSVFSTYSIVAASAEPFGNVTLATAGEKSWAGWPNVPRIEELRLDYARAPDQQAQLAIAAEIQKIAIDEGVVMPLGQFTIPSAFRAGWTGFPEAPVTLFWGVEKAAK